MAAATASGLSKALFINPGPAFDPPDPNGSSS
jgi:hypothetical protein